MTTLTNLESTATPWGAIAVSEPDGGVIIEGVFDREDLLAVPQTAGTSKRS